MQNFKNPIFQKRHYEFVADVIKDFVNEYEKKFGMGDSENDLIIEISESIGNHFAKEFTKISAKNGFYAPQITPTTIYSKKRV